VVCAPSGHARSDDAGGQGAALCVFVCSLYLCTLRLNIVVRLIGLTHTNLVIIMRIHRQYNNL